MAKARFVLIGGFLGRQDHHNRPPGARIAARPKVGIVTNDQATDLVDTHALRPRDSTWAKWRDRASAATSTAWRTPSSNWNRISGPT